MLDALCGADDERLAAIARMAAHPDVEVALAVRGGYGWTRLLDRLDFGALARAGKRWLGHSDFTAFQLAALAHAGMVTYAGPMAAYDFGAVAPSAWTLEHCFAAARRAPERSGVRAGGPVVVGRRHAVGRQPFDGGFAASARRHFPKVDGGILFLEDVAEHPYRIERMLYQLHHAGILARQRAVLLGTFTEFPLNGNDGGYDLTAAVAQLRSVADVPILTGLPFGHVPDKLTLPVGGRCALDVRDGAARLHLTDYT